jgi:hypothetical protein
MAPKKTAGSKAGDADATRAMASGFVTAMKAPSSTKEQKAALEYYQSLPRFSDVKKDILLKWKQDRSCSWFHSFKESHTKTVANTDERAQGYGTVSLPQLYLRTLFLECIHMTNVFLCTDHCTQRFDLAKLMNMDYRDDLQKKLVDKIASQLTCDELWDEEDDFERAYKQCGLKRYKIDKKMLGSVKETEEHSETLESSSSKDGKGTMKALFEKDEAGVKIEIHNPKYLEVSNTMKTTKSAADAVAALVSQMKRMLPSLQIVTGDAGLFCVLVF